MNLSERLLNRAVNYGTVIGAIFLMSVMSLVCFNVVYRIFGTMIPGQYELIEIMIVVVAAFCLSDTEIHHRQVNVDILINHLPKRLRMWLDNFGNLLSFIYWGLITWSSFILTMDKAARGEATDLLKISIIPFRVIWVMGLVLICLVIVYNTSNNVKELKGMSNES